jgi:hypothetical protein
MQPLPATLCRYRSLSDSARARTQRVVETGLHYFASPSSFNDPFDCRPNLTLEGTEHAVREYLYGMWARQEPQVPDAERKAEVEAILRDPSRDPRIPENNRLFAAAYDSLVTAQVGVLCLSEVHDDILMWSHYADCHKGICLIYETGYEFFAHAQPVRYQRERPSVNPVAQSTEEMLDNAIFTKSSAWAYEKEWRILHYRQGVGERQSPPTSLKTVILGVALSGGDRRLVEAWAKASPAKPRVLRAFLSPSQFAIHVPNLQ